MKHTAVRQVVAGVMIYFITIFQVFGQAALLPNAEQQYFDNNGHPLASGSVTYYVPGTTTKKTTWTTSGQTVNNTNPVNLDIGGKGIMYGQGSYRQVVKDSLGNVIWDQPTTAYGASQPSGATGTDTAPVGTVVAYTGFVVPTNWQLAFGQALSRTQFPDLLAAITIQATGISCTSSSTTLTGFTDTSTIRIGAPIEATCLPTSTTVASITNATTIVVSQEAAATSTVTATIFPWGNGDQVTTFNVPDLRGRSAVGADCMGFVAAGNACAGNLTSTFYGANPGAAGQTGGTQSKTLTLAQLPTGITSTGTVNVSGSVGGTVTVTLPGNLPYTNVPGTPGNSLTFTTPGSGGNAPGNGTGWLYTASITGFNTLSGSMSGSNTLTSNNTSGSAHSIVNPDATVNYIIKAVPNSTGAGGVVSFGGMFGDIVCNSTLICAPIANVNTVGCTPATTSQLGCVQPDGVTTKIVGGLLTAVAGVASSVGIGSTAITGGTNGEILSVSAGLLGQVATSGSGSVALTNSPTFVTPTLGAATATTLNTNTFTAGGYTLAGATGKTLTFNNTLTLAGTDGTTMTFPGTSDTVATLGSTQTLTNKTINGANNTLTVRLGSDVTGNLPLSNLATGSLDQVIGYFGATTGNAISINNCSNALTYSTTTHTFGCNTTAGTGTVTSVGLTNAYGLSVSGSPVTSSGNISAGVALSTGVNTMASDVSMTNTTAYFDGPSVAQGSTGLWLAIGTVTITDSSGSAGFDCKLWDGTSAALASTFVRINSNSQGTPVTLAGIELNATGNLRISCKAISDSTGKMVFNGSGNSADGTITAIRLQ